MFFCRILFMMKIEKLYETLDDDTHANSYVNQNPY